MTEQFIVFKRHQDGSVVYVKDFDLMTSDLNEAHRYSYHSEAKAVAMRYAMHVREITL